jgi:hypothetical protein
MVSRIRRNRRGIERLLGLEREPFAGTKCGQLAVTGGGVATCCGEQADRQ